MVQEKTVGKTRSSDENPSGETADESVLDFLWEDDAPEAAAPAPQPDTTPAEGLKGALAHYATWLSAWKKPA